MTRYVPLEHPRFVKAQRDVFIGRVVADCMSHRCAMQHQGQRERLDACCQYGADVDLSERDAILGHRDEIAALLRAEVASAPWFTDEITEDPDFPTGRHVRTRPHGQGDHQGCIFLFHDQRGCAVHRASIEGGWDFRGIKPHICRLFPLSYESDAIVLSDDYHDYSCAYDESAPTVYQVGRSVLADVFGEDLVTAMDAAEAAVLAQRQRLRAL